MGGFFRHGWIIYKWIITLALLLTGTFYLGPMTTRMLEIADVKRFAALLIIAVFFTIYKPWKNIRNTG